MKAWPPSTTLAQLDRLGVCLSLACTAQCLAAPAAVTLLPLAGLGLWVEGPLEAVFVGASMALATASLCWGFRVHRHWGVLGVVAGAATLSLLGYAVLEPPYEWAFGASGALVLAAGHLLNRTLCRACRRCGDDTDDAA
jgi:hypothetical protein